MKIIERVVESTGEPNGNDLWLRYKDGKYELKRYAGGEWIPVCGCSGGSDPIIIPNNNSMSSAAMFCDVAEKGNWTDVLVREVDGPVITDARLAFVTTDLSYDPEIGYLFQDASGREVFGVSNREFARIRAFVNAEKRYQDEHPSVNPDEIVHIDYNSNFIDRDYDDYGGEGLRVLSVSNYGSTMNLFLTDMNGYPIRATRDHSTIVAVSVDTTVEPDPSSDAYILKLTDEEMQTLVGYYFGAA